MQNKIESKPRIVGTFIKSKRAKLGLSQKALGQLFEPAVTTQFISNLERGVTPLPTNHVPKLAKALQISEAELMALLEKEYAAKLSGKLSKSEAGLDVLRGVHQLDYSRADASHAWSSPTADDYVLLQISKAYRASDSSTQQSFLDAAASVLKIPGGLRRAG
jgi:transcriptional regulator with XRE-family HTH domain